MVCSEVGQAFQPVERAPKGREARASAGPPITENKPPTFPPKSVFRGGLRIQNAAQETIAGPRGSDLAQHGTREHLQQDSLTLSPHPKHPAGRLQITRAATVDADVEGYRPFDRLDDIAKRNRLGCPSELITAAGAAARTHQAAPHQVAD